MLQIGRMVAAHHNEAKEETGPKAAVVDAAGVEGAEETKIGEIGRALDRNQMIEEGAIGRARAIWVVESTSMFTSSPLDLPN